ncbi:MAG: hypothetical protein K6T75_07475 [Acetobacteraceae bacterium]|nr:hypothetical protein [Acetobacteraceae bacterium]
MGRLRRLARWLGRRWALLAVLGAALLGLVPFWLGTGESYEVRELLLGRWGSGAGELGLLEAEGSRLGPAAFAPLPDGGVLVADTWNGRLLRFDRRGRLVPGPSWPQPSPGPAAGLAGIAVPVVAAEARHTPAGQAQSPSSAAPAPPECALPLALGPAPPPAPAPALGAPLLALAVDEGRVYLATGGSRQVQVLSLGGKPLAALELPADPAVPAEPDAWALEDLHAARGQLYWSEQVTGADGHRRRLWHLPWRGSWELAAEVVLSPQGEVTVGGRAGVAWNSLALDAAGRLCLEVPAESPLVRRAVVLGRRGVLREGRLLLPGVPDVVHLVGVDGDGCPFLLVEAPPGYVRVLRYPRLAAPSEDAPQPCSPASAWTSPPGVADLGMRACLGPRGALYLAEARREGYALRVIQRQGRWRLGWRRFCRLVRLARGGKG